MVGESSSNQLPEITPPDRIQSSPDRVSESELRRSGTDSTWQNVEPEERNYQQYLGVLYKRRWAAVAVFVTVLTFVIIHNFTAVPVYEARARVLVEAERVNLVNLVNIEDVIAQQRSLDTELAIMRSRWLVKKTVQSLGLTPEPNGAGGTQPQPDPGSWQSTAKTYAFKALGIFRPTPLPSEPLAGESLVEAQQIDAFLGGLSIALSAKGVLDIDYRSSDPVLTARFANAHAQQYINENLEMRFAAVKEVTDWLAARLAEHSEKVNASEQALERFREENGLIAAETSSEVVEKLNELSASIIRAQGERLQKEATYNRALALRANPDDLDLLPQMLSNPALQQLRLELERLQRNRTELAKTLREAHPDMETLQETIRATQARVDVERSRVLEAMRQDLATTRAAEASLANALAKMRLEATGQNRKSVELSVLMREAESNRQIYDMLLQRAREAGVAKEITPSRRRILDAAIVPTDAVSPNRRRNILWAIFTGFALAIGVAFGFEHLDNRIKAPHEIGQRLGLPFIGLLPEVKLKDKTIGPLATDGVPPEFAEELRRLRTNVLFSFAGDGLRSVVITSASPVEGKTAVATNLAIALAQAGQRVLLIDADLRRPMIHNQFSIRREPGLSNVLVGDRKAAEVVRRSSVDNLWILPAGRRPPNPSELLGSQEFKNFLAALDQHFDWVVIDTPPVMAVTDACVVAHVVAGTFFVIGSEMVSRHAARRAIEQLVMADAKVVGGILSRVQIGRYGHYYSSYYRGPNRKYREYYGETKAS